MDSKLWSQEKPDFDVVDSLVGRMVVYIETYSIISCSQTFIAKIVL